MADEATPEKRGPGRPPGVKTGQGQAAQAKAAAARAAAEARRGAPPAWMNSAALTIDPSAPPAEKKPEMLSKDLGELKPAVEIDRSKGAGLRMGNAGPGFTNWIATAIMPAVAAIEHVTSQRDDKGNVLVPGFNVDENRGPLFAHNKKGEGKLLQKIPISSILAVTGGEALAYYTTGDDAKDAPILMLVANLIVVGGLITQRLLTGKAAIIETPDVAAMIEAQEAADKAMAEKKKAEALAAAAPAPPVTNGHNAATA